MKVTLIGTLPPSKGVGVYAVAFLPAFGAPPSGILSFPNVHLDLPETI